METLTQFEARIARERANLEAQLKIAKLFPIPPRHVVSATSRPFVTFVLALELSIEFLEWIDGEKGGGLDDIHIWSDGCTNVVGNSAMSERTHADSRRPADARTIPDCVAYEIVVHQHDRSYRSHYYENTIMFYWKGMRCQIEIGEPGEPLGAKKLIEPALEYDTHKSTRARRMGKPDPHFVDKSVHRITWDGAGAEFRHTYYFPGLTYLKAALEAYVD